MNLFSLWLAKLPRTWAGCWVLWVAFCSIWLPLFSSHFFYHRRIRWAEKKPFLNIKNQEFNYDLRRMGREISGNFNAFLRGGTFTVVLIAIVVYSALLGALGVPYYFLLAVIAGFGRFIPYLGAFIGWVGFAIGALIQNPTPFGLTPFVYMLLVLGVSLFIDVILDHLVTPPA